METKDLGVKLKKKNWISNFKPDYQNFESKSLAKCFIHHSSHASNKNMQNEVIKIHTFFTETLLQIYGPKIIKWIRLFMTENAYIKIKEYILKSLKSIC